MEEHKPHHVEHHMEKKKKVSIWKIVSVILAALLLLSIFTSGLQFNKISKAKAQETALKFINENLLAGQSTATITSIEDTGSLYKIKLNIQGKDYDSYITRDAKILFPTAIELTPSTDNTIPTNPTTPDTTQTKATCESLTKGTKPILQAFVVSSCPYGLQMQRVLSEMINNIPTLKENIKVRYLGAVQGTTITSMHGDAEAQENLRQICIREEQSDKYWDYVSCFMKAGDSASCLTSAKVDQTKLTTCTSSTGKGLEYAKVDFALSDKFGVQGSPTLILNDKQVSEFDFGGRNADAVKTLLCCGFSTSPSTCTKTLSTTQAATAFSATYSGTGAATTAAANCGTPQ